MPPELLEWLSSCRADPVRFVQMAFPWGEGRLKGRAIETWQMELLVAIRDGLLTPNRAIRLARASGHGIGKSTVVAWIILWAFMTVPDTRGVITANTEPQLKTKTWAELGVWFNQCACREFFNHTATALLSRDRSRERTWRIDAVAWSEKNPEAFAGLHNKGGRLLLIFDEASAIEDIIWDTAQGAMTDADTEIIWCVFGNPTRNTGRFKECFSDSGFGKRWRTAQIDSRTVSISNKEEIASWVEEYGDDSDFVRVRVKGEFPRLGETEFISSAAIDAAMERAAEGHLHDPLACGVDVARYGENASVIWFRKGRDARTLPARRFRSISTVELAQHVISAQTSLRCDGLFIDGGGVGGGVVDNIRAQAYQCFDVQFGGKDDTRGTATGNTGERYANKRAAMYGALRAWINTGALPKDDDLRKELLSIRYALNSRGEIQLESKEEMRRRGAPSPDNADALALTFAYPLQPHPYAGGLGPTRPPLDSEYDPFSEQRMSA